MMVSPTSRTRILSGFSLVTVLGFIELILAALWVHPLGIVLAIFLLVTSAIRIMLYVQYSDGSHEMAPLAVEDGDAVSHDEPCWSEMEGADPSRPQARKLRVNLGSRWWWMVTIPQIFIACWVAALILVHLLAPDPDWHSFPAACSSDHSQNCARAGTNETSWRSDYDSPAFDAAHSSVMAKTKDWISKESGLIIKNELNAASNTTTIWLHARFLTVWMGFPDDFAVQVGCDAAGSSVVTVQSQSRLGVSDGNVNPDRLNKFVKWLLQRSFDSAPCGIVN